MIRNFFATAWQNLLRSKVYSLINITGLAIGLACAILIILYTKDEVSYDAFHDNGNRIFRIVNVHYNEAGDVERKGGFTGYYHGHVFARNIPEIATVVRFQGDIRDVKKGREVLREEVVNVDSTFLKVFNFPLLHGDAATALNDKSGIVISEEIAVKYFGSTDAVGKEFEFKEGDGFRRYIVSAVTGKCPLNSSIKFGILIPMQVPSEELQNKDNWFNFFLNTFVVLSPGADRAAVEEKMHRVYATDGKEVVERMAKDFDEKGTMQYFLQPLKELHLGVEYNVGNGLKDGSNSWYSFILSGIAIFMLLIACINFINLTIARSIRRSKEIGIRKVIGAGRRQLVLQFIGESFLITLISFLFAILLVQLSLPFFNSLSGKALSVSYLFDLRLVMAFSALLVCTGLLAGFYPAMVLSSFDPVKTLYNRFKWGGKNYLQRSLVVLQFTLATVMIIGTITIYRQFNYMLEKPLGYNDKNLVMVEKDQLTRDEYARFSRALLEDNSILSVSPRNSGDWGTGARINQGENVQFAYETVGSTYLPLMQLKIIHGRNFSSEMPSDSVGSVIVNETFVKKAGWKNPLGQEINFFWDNNRKMKVIGVVKDYHYFSLTQEIGPQVITMWPGNPYGMALIRIREGSDSRAIAHISSTFKSLFPLHPFSYRFREDANRNEYEKEAKWKQMLLFSAILTIFISCIGLFGLSVLNAESRTREIGIRKVLGAGVWGISSGLSVDFLRLVFLSLIVAFPVAWFAAAKWLENYPYRMPLNWTVFVATAIMVMAIAALTIGVQAIKAAMANPVSSLRNE